LSVWLVAVAGCTHSRSTFGGEIVWEDDDRHPVDPPAPRTGTKYWELVDHTVFRPLSRAFTFPEPEPARNVNALGEVPNSSWYTNRLSIHDLSPDRVARGPCSARRQPLDGSLRVTRAERTGHGIDLLATADATGRRYRIRLDHASQPGRATTADVVGSRIYWAAGFEVPCIRIAFVEPSEIEVDGASIPLVDAYGHTESMPRVDVRGVLDHVTRRRGNQLRIAVNPRLPGRPLGPFAYSGTRRDDPNDVVPHQHRRELRGERLVAAWMGHFDVRQHNTATTFLTRRGERGYVQHFWTDFDDSLGAVWFSDEMSRRFSHSYHVDLGDVVTDLLTLGLLPRPWHDAHAGSPHPVFGYFDAKDFRPRRWKPGVPNLAFRQMNRRDGFWAAKIVSRFSDAHVRAIVERAHLRDTADARYLIETLQARRDRIVREYFSETAPLAFPRTRGNRLCFEDLMVSGGYVDAERADYRLRRRDGGWLRLVVDGARICTTLSGLAVGDDIVVEARVEYDGMEQAPEPTRFHLRRTARRLRVVGIVR
jgi:hypothetical protein